MSDIFLSYSREDGERVAPLVEFLTSRGFDVWWDRHISPGDSFEEVIDKRILDAGCVVVVWSHSSINSRWVKNEALEGLEREILVPVQLDDVRTPVAFRQTQAANFTSWPGSVDEDEARSFLEAVNRILEQDEVVSTAGLPTKPGSRWSVRWALAGLLVIAMVVSGAMYLVPAQEKLKGDDKSLAVLRFRNISDHQDTYLPDSIASELHDRLQSLNGVTLASQFASWDIPAEYPRAETTRRLGVQYILEGKLINSNGRDRILLSLAAADGILIWDREYDAAIELQQLTQRMTDHLLTVLKVPVSDENDLMINETYTAIESAYDEYLKGNDLLRQSSSQDGLEQARQHFANAVEYDNRFIKAYSGLCRSNIALYDGDRDASHFEDAEKACNRALTLNPAEAEAYLALGELYLYSGQADAAEMQVTKVLSLDATNTDAYILYGRVLSELSQYNEALQAFNTAVTKQPGYWKSFNARGAFSYQHGNYADAIRDFTEVTYLDPENVKALNNLGTARYLSGEFEAAIGAWQKSDSIQPSRSALSNMGTGYYYLRDFDQAADMYQRALKQTTEDHRLWGNLADVQRMNNQPDAANKNYEKAISLAEAEFAINNRDPNTSARLAVYHASLGNRDEAIENISLTLQLGGGNPFMEHDLTVARIILGLTEEANKSYAALKNSGYPTVLIDAEPMFDALHQ